MPPRRRGRRSSGSGRSRDAKSRRESDITEEVGDDVEEENAKGLTGVGTSDVVGSPGVSSAGASVAKDEEVALEEHHVLVSTEDSTADTTVLAVLEKLEAVGPESMMLSTPMVSVQLLDEMIRRYVRSLCLSALKPSFDNKHLVEGSGLSVENHQDGATNGPSSVARTSMQPIKITTDEDLSGSQAGVRESGSVHVVENQADKKADLVTNDDTVNPSKKSGGVDRVVNIECANCGATVSASRYASHLEKCLGKGGRSSSRAASARLRATVTSESEPSEPESEECSVNSNGNKRRFVGSSGPRKSKPSTSLSPPSGNPPEAMSLDASPPLDSAEINDSSTGPSRSGLPPTGRSRQTASHRT